MKKRHIILFVIIGLLCGLISLFITLYPLLSNYFAEKNKSTVHTAYTQTVDTMRDDSIEAMRQAARAYNAALAASPVTLGGAFTEEAQESAEEDYYDLLNVLANGIMGYIEIPKISVYLPIYHSTHSDVLQHGVGHLTGSSLPVGGADTHTILAGHSGLAREKMFSDLEQVGIGDVFYLHVLDETLAYEVDRIKTVLPENTDYLSIEKGEDYCTLITCVPFGVNTHRLLVRGTRVEYAPEGEANQTAYPEEATVISTWEQQYLKGLLYGGGLVIVLLPAAILILRRGGHAGT